MFSRLKKIVPVPVKKKIRRFLNNLRPDKQYQAISFLLRLPEAILGRYITFHTRPRYAKDVFVDTAAAARDYSAYAIVMHSAVVTKNRFTLETLLLYKKFFPGAAIILSTGEGEDGASIDEARRSGIEVLCHKKVENPGPAINGRSCNINLQITSSRAGVRRAAELHKKYVLRVRTDQRMYSQETLAFLSNLVERFPLRAAGGGQRGRIVGFRANNAKTKPYLFPDHMIFGYTEDVSAYFEADFVPADATLGFPGPASPFVSEIYLCTEFLKKVGYPVAYTYEDYLRALAERFILADAASLDWYFAKYGRFSEYKNRSYRNDKYNLALGFPEWFDLYCRYN